MKPHDVSPAFWYHARASTTFPVTAPEGCCKMQWFRVLYFRTKRHSESGSSSMSASSTVMEKKGSRTSMKCSTFGSYSGYLQNSARRWNVWKYCWSWWKKSCTTWDVWNPVNNRIYYQPQLVSLPDFWTINSITKWWWEVGSNLASHLFKGSGSYRSQLAQSTNVDSCFPEPTDPNRVMIAPINRHQIDYFVWKGFHIFAFKCIYAVHSC